LTALLRQLDLRRIILVCHDWGGPTGLGFAFSNPGRVTSRPSQRARGTRRLRLRSRPREIPPPRAARI
jgi:pimeloyl-ACP methyl ester carboxylesterase